MTPTQKVDAAKKLLLEAQLELGTALDGEKSRKRSTLTRTMWEVQRMLGIVPQYFSQSGQDRIVDNMVTDGKHGGVFADIGGYDGVTGSNTMFFEVFRNWTGILVEPTPDNLEQALTIRSCPCEGLGVAPKPGQLDFLHIQKGYRQMSGFLDTYDQDLLKRVREHPNHVEQTITVPTKSLAEIFTSHDMTQIDYVSLDIEGGELAVLESFPFADFDITSWSIENNAASTDIPKLMRDKGYDLIEFSGVDDIYKKNPINWISDPIL